MSAATLDIDRQRQAKEYARLRRRLMLVDLMLGAVYLFAWLAFGWSQGLKSALSGWTSNEWLLVAGFAAIFGACYLLLTLPLSFFEGFILPHRYNLSNQTLTGWISDQLKGALLGGTLGGLLLELVYAVLRAYPQTWWLWAAGLLLLVDVILANLGPVLIFPIFYKFVPLGEEHAELAERLMSLAEKAGAQVRGVFKFDMSRRTKSANAALAGLGNTRRILLGDTLLDEFTPDEIETVLAHELGHHVHKDIPAGMAVGALLTLFGLFLASLALRWGVSYFGFSAPGDIAALPLFALAMALYGLVTMPLGNAYSRWRESRADAYALQLTGKGEAYASALTRLANQNLAEVDPEPWVELLLYSHPALGKRIARVKGTAP